MILIIVLACNQSPKISTNTKIKSPIDTSQVDQWIETIKSQFAPDKRTALFDLSSKLNEEGLVLIGETNLPDAYNALVEKLKGNSWIDSIQLLPSSEFKDKPYGLINISTCNIRAEARHSSELSTQAILGTPIKIYKKQGGWYYIQTPDGYLGWLNEGTFTNFSDEEFNAYKQKPKGIFIADMGRVYEQSTLSGKTIRDLSLGNIFVILQKKGSSVQVLLPDGQSGYVNADLVISWDQWVNRIGSTREEILVTAHQLLGRPYLWGGTSSKGMDCSGFTKTVFFAHHMILPRDASQQVMVGELIIRDINELHKVKPGDLLFFGRKEKERDRVTHVGIYLGNDRMIHSGDGRVQIQSLNPDHSDYIAKRRNSFLSARDMLSKAGSNEVILVKDSAWYQ
jgi:hypothetical protein